MTDKEKEFVKRINIDKANKKTVLCIIFTVISLLSYVIPLIFGDFDFGVIFEIFTLIFIILARIHMSDYDEIGSKRFIIFAMIPIGWLLIFDLMTLLSYIHDAVDLAFLGTDFIFQEGLTIVSLLVMVRINQDLRKADNPEKYKESTDWFYERLDKEEDKQ